MFFPFMVEILFCVNSNFQLLTLQFDLFNKLFELNANLKLFEVYIEINSRTNYAIN